jgi:hypothetical protein
MIPAAKDFSRTGIERIVVRTAARHRTLGRALPDVFRLRSGGAS